MTGNLGIAVFWQLRMSLQRVNCDSDRNNDMFMVLLSSAALTRRRGPIRNSESVKERSESCLFGANLVFHTVFRYLQTSIQDISLKSRIIFMYWHYCATGTTSK